MGTLKPRPLGCGRGCPIEICFSRTYATILNSIILDKTVYERSYVALPENFVPSRPALQGYSRSLEPTPIDRPLYMTSYYFSIVITGPSRTVFEINGNISKIFPLLVHLTPPLRRFRLEFCNGSGARKKTMMSLYQSVKNV